MDFTVEEFKNSHLIKFDLNNAFCNGTPHVLPQVTAPDSFDWRDHGAVTPVLNQGELGAGWTIPVTENIEGVWAAKHNNLTALSIQQLVDCTDTDADCDQLYNYVIKVGGMESKEKYPSRGGKDTCKFNKDFIVASIIGCNYVSKDEEEIKNVLYQIGPLTIGINAADMQFYSKGIDNPSTSRCKPEAIDHAAVLVGYGIENKVPFWIIKNSWGTSWGEKGYYRIVRGKGACGVNRFVSTGISA